MTLSIRWTISMTPGSTYKVIVAGRVIAEKPTYRAAVRAANKATKEHTP